MAANVHKLKARLRAARTGCPACKQPLDTEFCPNDGFPAIPFDKLDLTDVLQGTSLDSRYLVMHRIGRGAMADVYAAWDSGARNEVALKLVRPELARDETIVTRFRREAAAISKLEHPHIIRMCGAGRSPEGVVYIVLERLVGRTLEDYIQHEAPLEPRKAAALLAPLCMALQALHDLGIMHRDLKPANIFLALDSDGNEALKLLDFGIARRLRSDPIDDKLSGGKVLGSVCYAAPEIALKTTLDQRTDLYSVGVLLYELLTGHLPYDAPTPLDVLRRQVQEDVPPLPDWIPEPFRALVFELLAKSPEFRPPDAAEVSQRLRDLALGLHAPSADPQSGGLSLDRTAAMYGALDDTEEPALEAALPTDVQAELAQRAAARAGMLPLAEVVRAPIAAEPIRGPHRPVAAARVRNVSRWQLVWLAAAVVAATVVALLSI
jgi:serine/threonine-protein kinase